MPLPYVPMLRERSRELRNIMTKSEQYLWQRLRKKQILGIQFYRQKPIGCYIADFYAPAVQLVIELDGSGHFEENQIAYDKIRTDFLESLSLSVLRFTNTEVLTSTRSVLDCIYQHVKKALELKKNPPARSAIDPLFQSG